MFHIAARHRTLHRTGLMGRSARRAGARPCRARARPVKVRLTGQPENGDVYRVSKFRLTGIAPNSSGPVVLRLRTAPDARSEILDRAAERVAILKYLAAEDGEALRFTAVRVQGPTDIRGESAPLLSTMVGGYLVS